MSGSGMIISYEELRILLYNRGFRSSKGILMPDEQVTDEQVLQDMNKLAARGRIEAKGDYFEFSEEAIQIAEAIGAPLSSYYFEDAHTGQLYYCYFKEGLVVIAENNLNKKNTLRIRSYTPAQFSAWREELEKE